MENNLKPIRLSIGMTQAELGEISGINSHNIWRNETAPNLSNVTIGTVYALAHAMGVTVNDIIYPMQDSK